MTIVGIKSIFPGVDFTMMPPIIQGMMPPAGFEPTNSLRRTDLKSVAFDHSAKMAREGGPNQVRGLMV